MSARIPSDARIVVPGDLISTHEVARILGVDRATVVRRARAGTMPVVAQLDAPARSGAFVFDRSEINAYKEGKKNG